MDFNFMWLMIGFFAMVIFLGVLKRNNQLTETKFAVTAMAYWSYLSMSAINFFSRAMTSKNILLLGIVLLIIWWTIGYQFSRWLYRQFNSDK